MKGIKSLAEIGVAVFARFALAASHLRGKSGAG